MKLCTMVFKLKFLAVKWNAMKQCDQNAEEQTKFQSKLNF